MEYERASVMTKEDVKMLVAEVLQQCRPPDRAEETTLKSGNELTLSLFSELRYALGAPSLNREPIRQQLPAEITANGYLEFAHTLPAWATTMIVVRSGVCDELIRLPASNPPPPIYLTAAEAVVAVKVLDTSDEVRLVTFVTHVSRKTPASKAKGSAATGAPNKGTAQTATQSRPMPAQATQVKTP
jgi:hypothetical protein